MGNIYHCDYFGHCIFKRYNLGSNLVEKEDEKVWTGANDMGR